MAKNKIKSREPSAEYLCRKYILLPFKILHISIRDAVNQDGFEHAGYLAFLILLSLFPFLIFLITIIGLFGESESGIEIIRNVLSLTPDQISAALLPRIDEIIYGRKNSFLTIAILGVIWTASSSVEGCRTVLNRAYRVEFPPPYLLRRFVSIIQFVIISILITLGIITFIILPALLRSVLGAYYSNIDLISHIYYFKNIALLFILFTSTSLLYYILPNVKQKYSRTIPGTLLAIILWSILLKLFTLYISYYPQINLVYGSLTGIILSLLFFYLVSFVFILGAEFNYHCHRVYKIMLKSYL